MSKEELAKARQDNLAMEKKIAELVKENQKMNDDRQLLEARATAQQKEMDRIVAENELIKKERIVQNQAPVKTKKKSLEEARDVEKQFHKLVAHIKPYTGAANEDFYYWWREIDLVLQMLGDKRKLLKGGVFLQYLSPQVRLSMNNDLKGLGDKPIGEAEIILKKLLIKRGGDSLVRFQEWKFDPALQFEVNLGYFNTLGDAVDASAELRITTWLKAIPSDLQKGIAGRRENWKMAGWVTTTQVCEERWRRIIEKKKLGENTGSGPQTPKPEESVNTIQTKGCFQCRREGHFARDCWQPRSILRSQRGRRYERENSRSRSRSRSRSQNRRFVSERNLDQYHRSKSPSRKERSSNQRCFHCKKEGHFDRECPELRKRSRSRSRERPEAKKTRFNLNFLVLQENSWKCLVRYLWSYVF